MAQNGSVQTLQRAGGATPGEDVTWLALIPRDTVVVRDGRPFDAGADTRGESVWPWPSTVGGAVRAAYGAEAREIRGPFLARRDRGGWMPYFPMPADVAEAENNPERGYLLRPDPELRNVTTDLGDTTAELLAAPKGRAVKPADGWLPATRMAAYLRGEFPASGFPMEEFRRPREAPIVEEIRAGLARTRDRTARDGYLYRMTHLRPRDGWAFLVGCVAPPGKPRGPVKLGGRGRLADLELAVDVTWPIEALPTYPGGRVLLYVATPALWPGGWLPPVTGARVVGAAVPAPVPVSTASPHRARAERKRLIETANLWWAVPAGTVYLLRFNDEDTATAWAHAHHGRALGPALGATAEEDRLRTAGFGIVLTGTWKDA